MKFSSAVVVSLLLPFWVLGQTSNDNIENRIEIAEDTPLQSLTNGNTVQWNCVDEKLTGKCIKYHNDQWYYFTALNAAKQYINISGQECRDLWGVQLVVIDGIPCETESYNIITCVSLATQDDVFAELQGLVPGKEYLLNVDGYLHDYCSFSLELSLTPKGLPVIQEIQVEASDNIRNDTLNYYWETPDSLMNSISLYSLYRRQANEVKFTLIKEFPAKQDAFGTARKSYKYSQLILPDNNPWTYKLIANKDGNTYVVDQFSASASWRTLSKVKYRIEPEISLTSETDISISLVDYIPGLELEKKNIHYVPGQSEQLYFNITDYIKAGITRFMITVRNLDNGDVSYQHYEYLKGSGVQRMR